MSPSLSPARTGGRILLGKAPVTRCNDIARSPARRPHFDVAWPWRGSAARRSVRAEGKSNRENRGARRSRSRDADQTQILWAGCAAAQRLGAEGQCALRGEPEIARSRPRMDMTGTFRRAQQGRKKQSLSAFPPTQPKSDLPAFPAFPPAQPKSRNYNGFTCSFFTSEESGDPFF